MPVLFITQLLTHTLKHTHINKASFRFHCHIQKGIFSFKNKSCPCFSLFLRISTWMNVWLCYFSRTGRPAHVVDSLIKASLEKLLLYDSLFQVFSVLWWERVISSEINFVFVWLIFRTSSTENHICPPHFTIRLIFKSHLRPSASELHYRIK